MVRASRGRGSGPASSRETDATNVERVRERKGDRRDLTGVQSTRMLCMQMKPDRPIG